MTPEHAIELLSKCRVPMGDNADEVIAGRALIVLLCNGYHDFEFDSLESGGTVLCTGNIEIVDEREYAQRGHIQRSTELLVRAAIESAGMEVPW